MENFKRWLESNSFDEGIFSFFNKNKSEEPKEQPQQSKWSPGVIYMMFKDHIVDPTKKMGYVSSKNTPDQLILQDIKPFISKAMQPYINKEYKQKYDAKGNPILLTGAPVPVVATLRNGTNFVALCYLYADPQFANGVANPRPSVSYKITTIDDPSKAPEVLEKLKRIPWSIKPMRIKI